MYERDNHAYGDFFRRPDGDLYAFLSVRCDHCRVGAYFDRDNGPNLRIILYANDTRLRSQRFAGFRRNR